MLAHENTGSRGGIGVVSSDTFKMVLIILKDRARNAIYLSVDVVFIEIVTFDSQDLAASCVTRDSINRVDSSNGFSFVASSVLVVAVNH